MFSHFNSEQSEQKCTGNMLEWIACVHMCVCALEIVRYVNSRGVRLIGSEKEVGVSLSSMTSLFT